MRASVAWSASAVMLCGVVAISALALYWHHWIHSALPVEPSLQVLEVRQGATLRSVAHELHSKKLLRWPNVWRYYARFFDSRPIRAGEYRLASVESPVSILNLLQSGEVIHYSLTLLDGKRFKDYLDVLAAAPKLRTNLSGLTPDAQLGMLNLPVAHPEGWFYPDTYYYIAGDSDVDILRRAYKKMVTVLEEEWASRLPDLPYQSAYDALIMASVVEKETGVADERATIAGVFVRRLQKNMRLQTDPTVIYGLGESFSGNLTRQHLRTDSPYNTYVRMGLPPTPIAMPSRLAIRAAMQPSEGKALFFVAKGDGTHYFSETLEEHNRAVDRFQRQMRVKDYKSSPIMKERDK